MTRLRGSPAVLGLLAACALSGGDLRAQDAPAAVPANGAFDSLAVALRMSANVNRNTFHEFWDPRAGLELEVATPFYVGTAEAGLHVTRFSGAGVEQPDFSAWFPYLGWGLAWSPHPRLRWRNGARVGMSFMRFDEVASNRDERELGVELASRLAVTVSGPWAVDVGARYQVVFTRERLRLLFLTAGARYALPMPSWLKEFLS